MTPSSFIRVLHRPATPQVRLVAFPYAGGSSEAFSAWPDAMGTDIELCAAVLPGRESLRREPVPPHVSQLFAGLLRASSVLPPLPTALFGHSMGAILAHDFAHLLLAHGTPLVAFIASGSEAPHVNGAGELAALDDDGLVRIADERWDGFPDELRAPTPLRASVLSLVRSDLALLATCAPRHAQRLACPVHVLGGRGDRRLTRASLEAWRAHTRSPLGIHLFEGGHLFLLNEAARVAALVAQCVRAALPARGSVDSSI
jgi:surfactin synthase thioesterase subunit